MTVLAFDFVYLILFETKQDRVLRQDERSAQ